MIPPGMCGLMCSKLCVRAVEDSSLAGTGACCSPNCVNGLPYYFLPLSKTLPTAEQYSRAQGNGTARLTDKHSRVAALSFTCDSIDYRCFDLQPCDKNRKL